MSKLLVSKLNSGKLPSVISLLIEVTQSMPSKLMTSLLYESLTPTETTSSPPFSHKVGPTNFDQYPDAGEISSTFMSSSRPKNSNTSPGLRLASRATSAASRTLLCRFASILDRVAAGSAPSAWLARHNPLSAMINFFIFSPY